MKNLFLLNAVIFLLGTKGSCQKSQINHITCYYTRLSFDDNNFTRKFADIVIDIHTKGKFIFSREYSYQPYWQPANGKQFPVDRLISRIGDGPKERPDKNNICSNVSIVEKSAVSVKVHWRYAPDMTRPSFIDFMSAYNAAGNPSEFYAEYTDEYFNINADDSVIREVKKGCYCLDDWNDPENHILQEFPLTSDGIKLIGLKKPKLSNRKNSPVESEKVNKSLNSASILNFKFDDALNENKQQIFFYR